MPELLDARALPLDPVIDPGRRIAVAPAREEIDPPRESVTVTDPEVASIRRALTSETRAAYIEAFGSWRERIAHDFSDAGVGYVTAVIGDETAEHLVRRITAPRGVGVAVPQ